MTGVSTAGWPVTLSQVKCHRLASAPLRSPQKPVTNRIGNLSWSGSFDSEESSCGNSLVSERGSIAASRFIDRVTALLSLFPPYNSKTTPAISR